MDKNFRRTEKIIDDVHYQVIHKSYEIDEIAARFHHRLVAVHLFPNGNGRHARLMMDILLISLNQSRFTWGKNDRENLYESSGIRKKYITALKAADKYNYQLLFEFVRSK